ncbi:MAG TPA: hypothetical protein DCL41_05085 [Bdellovibrionales bacterium]|nr:hypothetical protein [Pseudobdellovibrionaceae bacterium]HAG91221.1 hypothetical protein [Bdellovibrionales bacterium]|tara:strand:+ start:2768 stop:3055 length:288 start_codon:yes stop_codon:yes gene_type:complete
MKFYMGILLASLFIAGCSSQPIVPTSKDIEVTRKELPDCENLGNLTGKSMHATGGKEQALEDLKDQAADKGATHVQVHQFSSMGTAVTGTLYKCK